VAIRAVVTTADEDHDDDQQEQDEGDHPKYFHPPWYAGVAVDWGYEGGSIITVSSPLSSAIVKVI
jgi:hypothetical protein